MVIKENTKTYLRSLMTKDSKDMYHKVADYAYIAGLFDGEGCVQYKQYWDTKRKDRPRRY